MKKRTNRQYAQILYNALDGIKEKEREEVLKNFIALLAHERKLTHAEKIIAEFIDFSKQKEGIENIKITVAREISNRTLEEIKNNFGSKVEAKVEVNEDILGGIIIETKDKILDGSLKTQLKNLKTQLA